MYKYDPCAIKYRIKDLMGEHDVSQRKLAEILGISQPAVSGYLNDMEPERCFSLEQLIKIANHFQVSLDTIIASDSDVVEDLPPIRTMAEFATTFYSLYKRINFSIEYVEILSNPYENYDVYVPVIRDKKVNSFLHEFKKIATASSDEELVKKFLDLWINDFISKNKDNYLLEWGFWNIPTSDDIPSEEELLADDDDLPFH